MTKTKIDLKIERKIITNMILSTAFLREISPELNPRFFRSSYAKTVSGWVLEYWQQYKEAPGKLIQDIYVQKSLAFEDDEDAEAIADFLHRLSTDWEKLSKLPNVSYEITSAQTYLRVRSLDLLREQLASAVAEGDPAKGEQFISNFAQVGKGHKRGSRILRDHEAIISAFSAEEERLFTFRGALGRVVGPYVRSDFAGVLAPMGRGKTWWLWAHAEEAMMNGLKATFITLEMPERHMLRRGWQSLTGSPREAGTYNIPVFQRIPGTDRDERKQWMVAAAEKDLKPVNLESVDMFQQRLRRRFRTGDIQIVSLPSYTTTVDDIEAVLDNMQFYNDYQTDVLVVDYADLLAARKGLNDYRQQLNSIWMQLRSIAEVRNILVVTASQSDRKTFSQDASEANVSEDIRKLAHVTKMIALNQTPEEYKMGIMRINQLKERDGHRTFDTALVLQCLDIGHPILDSRMLGTVDHQVSYDKKNDE